MTLQIIGFVLIFFLPVIESFNQYFGYFLLLAGSLFISFQILWEGRIKLDKINAFWIIMLIIFALSIFRSISFYRSFIEYARYFAYFLIFLAIRSFEKPEKIFSRFFLSMIIVNSVILCILAFIYSIPFLHLSKPPSMGLFYPSFGHNNLVNILIFAIPITVDQVMVQKQKLRKLCWSILSFVFLFFFFVSFGRAALIGFVASVFICNYFLHTKSKLWNWLGAILGLGMILTFVAIFYVSNINGPLRTDFLIINKLYRPFVQDYHLANDYQALAAWSQKPFLGWGLNSFRLLAGIFPPVNKDWYTHNHYLEILSETGLTGFMVFMTLVLFLFNLLIQKLRNIPVQKDSFLSIGIFIALLATSIQSFFDYQWHFLSVFLFFWTGFAAILPSTIGVNKKLPWRLLLIIAVFLFIFACDLPYPQIMY